MAPLRVMGTGVLQRPSDDAANPRGAKVPTGRRPCKEKHRRYARSERAVATDLTRIGDKARQEPTLVFTTLYHHITDVDNLRACYDRLPAHKASGVDGVTKAEYGEHLRRAPAGPLGAAEAAGLSPGPEAAHLRPKGGQCEGPAAGHQQSGRQDCRSRDPPHAGAHLRSRLRRQQLRLPAGTQPTSVSGCPRPDSPTATRRPRGRGRHQIVF